ncbi:MAG: hypothetical protein M3R08_01180 [Bacteroidota bacterium]|nr:hypothetical protein [Bacteroidota bacterium]
MNTRKIHFLSIAILLMITACGSEEQRRGAPQDENGENISTEGKIRPGVDGSEATGQSPSDTISKGDEGATSY